MWRLILALGFACILTPTAAQATSYAEVAGFLVDCGEDVDNDPPPSWATNATTLEGMLETCGDNLSPPITETPSDPEERFDFVRDCLGLTNSELETFIANCHEEPDGGSGGGGPYDEVANFLVECGEDDDNDPPPSWATNTTTLAAVLDTCGDSLSPPITEPPSDPEERFSFVRDCLGLTTQELATFTTNCEEGPDGGGGGGGNPETDFDLAGIPSCEGNTPYSVAPVELPDAGPDAGTTKHLMPLGNVTPGEHTFPTPFIFVAKPSSATTVDVVAPADIYVKQVRASYVLDGAGNVLPTSEYELAFYACAEVESRFHHLTDLSSTLTTALSSASWTKCTPEVRGTATSQSCTYNINQFVPAGTRVASHVNQLVMETNDARIEPHTFAGQMTYLTQRNGYDTYHAVCSVDYFTATPKAAFESESMRDVSPVCGELELDVPHHAQGIWYLAGNKSAAPNQWHHLSLDPYSIDPGESVFSIGEAAAFGNTPVGYRFEPMLTGTTNLDFGLLAPGRTVYCYDNLTLHSNNAAATDTILLLRLVDEWTLQLQRHTVGSGTINCGTPTRPRTLTPGAYAEYARVPDVDRPLPVPQNASQVASLLDYCYAFRTDGPPLLNLHAPGSLTTQLTSFSSASGGRVPVSTPGTEATDMDVAELLSDCTTGCYSSTAPSTMTLAGMVSQCRNATGRRFRSFGTFPHCPGSSTFTTLPFDPDDIDHITPMGRIGPGAVFGAPVFGHNGVYVEVKTDGSGDPIGTPLVAPGNVTVTRVQRDVISNSSGVLSTRYYFEMRQCDEAVTIIGPVMNPSTALATALGLETFGTCSTRVVGSLTMVLCDADTDIALAANADIGTIGGVYNGIEEHGAAWSMIDLLGTPQALLNSARLAYVDGGGFDDRNAVCPFDAFPAGTNRDALYGLQSSGTVCTGSSCTHPCGLLGQDDALSAMGRWFESSSSSPEAVAFLHKWGNPAMPIVSVGNTLNADGLPPDQYTLTTSGSGSVNIGLASVTTPAGLVCYDGLVDSSSNVENGALLVEFNAGTLDIEWQPSATCAGTPVFTSAKHTLYR